MLSSSTPVSRFQFLMQASNPLRSFRSRSANKVPQTSITMATTLSKTFFLKFPVLPPGSRTSSINIFLSSWSKSSTRLYTRLFSSPKCRKTGMGSAAVEIFERKFSCHSSGWILAKYFPPPGWLASKIPPQSVLMDGWMHSSSAGSEHCFRRATYSEYRSSVLLISRNM